LRNAFPQKSEAEIQAIARTYYRHLCDLLVETVKLLAAKPLLIQNRVRFSEKAKQTFQSYFDNKQSIIVVMGHCGNWEWAGARFALTDWQQIYAIYHPLSNESANRIFHRIRTRFGGKLYTMQETFRGMLQNRNALTMPAFIADQTPSNARKAYWTQFLNQDTPIFRGPERIARKLNFPIVYASVKRLPRRGYYEIDTEVLVDQPKDAPEDAVSEAFTRRLEQDILEQPANWLWSHRRWKRRRPD